MNADTLLRHVEEAVPGVTFATSADKLRFAQGVIRSALPNARRSLFVVSGPPMSGKSQLINLVARICAGGEGSWHVSRLLAGNKSCRAWLRSLSEAGDPIAKVDCRGSRSIGCSELDAFLSSKTYAVRRFGQVSEYARLRPAIWCESSQPLRFRADTERRVMFVRLGSEPTERCSSDYLRLSSQPAVDRLRGSLSLPWLTGLTEGEIEVFLRPLRVQP